VARKPPNRRPRPAPGRTPPQIRQGVPDARVANKVAVTTAPALVKLAALPKFVPALGALAVLSAGLIAGGVIGLVLLLALAGALGWFLAAFWPVTPTGGRVLRLAVVIGLVVIGVANAGR
jgi:hypothetical protein